MSPDLNEPCPSRQYPHLRRAFVFTTEALELDGKAGKLAEDLIDELTVGKYKVVMAYETAHGEMLAQQIFKNKHITGLLPIPDKRQICELQFNYNIRAVTDNVPVNQTLFVNAIDNLRLLDQGIFNPADTLRLQGFGCKTLPPFKDAINRYASLEKAVHYMLAKNFSPR